MASSPTGPVPRVPALDIPIVFPRHIGGTALLVALPFSASSYAFRRSSSGREAPASQNWTRKPLSTQGHTTKRHAVPGPRATKFFGLRSLMLNHGDIHGSWPRESLDRCNGARKPMWPLPSLIVSLRSSPFGELQDVVIECLENGIGDHAGERTAGLQRDCRSPAQ